MDNLAVAARMSSFLRFQSFAERDACEVAVKDSAAAGKLIVGLWEVSDCMKVTGLQLGDACALTVMSRAIGGDSNSFSNDSRGLFIGGFDAADGRFTGSGAMPVKAGPKALAFALQQIRDAEII